jgi:hypothetical protein
MEQEVVVTAEHYIMLLYVNKALGHTEAYINCLNKVKIYYNSFLEPKSQNSGSIWSAVLK